jgi:hypothetical protein
MAEARRRAQQRRTVVIALLLIAATGATLGVAVARSGSGGETQAAHRYVFVVKAVNSSRVVNDVSYVSLGSRVVLPRKTLIRTPLFDIAGGFYLTKTTPRGTVLCSFGRKITASNTFPNANGETVAVTVYGRRAPSPLTARICTAFESFSLSYLRATAKRPAGIGAFHGIKAAQHPRTAADRLDPSVVASIRRFNKQQARVTHTRRGLLEPDTSRLVRQLPNGVRVFAVAGTGDAVCVLLERLPRLGPNMKRGGNTQGCTSPLTQKVPSTLESFRAFKGPHGESPALSWGITLDGATTVSFPANRRLTITVPVKHNVWVYEGKWSATVRGFAVHFKDGHTETIP